MHVPYMEPLGAWKPGWLAQLRNGCSITTVARTCLESFFSRIWDCHKSRSPSRSVQRRQPDGFLEVPRYRSPKYCMYEKLGARNLDPWKCSWSVGCRRTGRSHARKVDHGFGRRRKEGSGCKLPGSLLRDLLSTLN